MPVHTHTHTYSHRLTGCWWRHSCWGSSRRAKPRSRHSPTTWTAAVSLKTSLIHSPNDSQLQRSTSKFKPKTGGTVVYSKNNNTFKKFLAGAWGGGWEPVGEEWAVLGVNRGRIPTGTGAVGTITADQQKFWMALKGLVGMNNIPTLYLCGSQRFFPPLW